MSDILVIGAGAVGCLTALELRRRGAEVTLVDQGQLGAESSWAGGGILFPLLPWNYAEPVNRLALAGASLYPRLAAELAAATGIDPQYRRCGMRVSGNFGANAALAWCRAHEVEAELEHDALWLPGVAQARNPRLMQALKAQLLRNGVTVLESAGLAPLDEKHGRIDGWRGQDGTRFRADAFVLSAGAWSQSLLGERSTGLSLKPMRGQMLLYRLAADILPHIVYQDDFYLIPRNDGHILAGSTVEDAGFDKSTTEEAAGDLHMKAGRLLPALASAPVIKHWSGLRPGSPENVPVIARHPAFENLYLNTGHFRYGVTMAPASATLLANLLEGKADATAKDYAYPAEIAS